MSDLGPRRPHRFRRRLTAAFILVAAVSSGSLALLTYGVTSETRWRNFERRTQDEVRVALALAPDRLDEQSFERMQAAYEKRAGTDTIGLGAGRSFSSAVTLTGADVPDEVRDGPSDELVTTRATRQGSEYHVVAGDGPDGSRYVFFFSLDQVHSSLRELRIVLLAGWIVVVALAATVGHVVARRTLRPVREAAEAATAVAGGLLDTRLPSVGEDEFTAWADSFNGMVDALGATIGELAATAERQRQLTADVAHDLRTPLTGMAVTAQLLADQVDDLPPTAARAARVLARDVTRLRDLVLALLELSRLDEGADPVRAEDLDVAAALASTLDGLHLPEDIVVDLDVAPGLAVRAERVRFRRIVGNVVANAAVHGRGPITVRAWPDGDVVAVSVHDEGPGIDPARAERVFDRFAKGDASRAQGGSGLGLAIAREHARAQGGDLVVDPGWGHGATFTLTLPAAPARTPTEPEPVVVD